MLRDGREAKTETQKHRQAFVLLGTSRELGMVAEVLEKEEVPQRWEVGNLQETQT